MASSAPQVPPPGKLSLDHVAHFVPHIEAASEALERLGFTLTPFSAQSHRVEPGSPLLPAGTGNRCAMLDRGYLEFLTPTGDTTVAHQLRSAILRYTGAHLVAFGTAAPGDDHARLARQGYAPLPPVALQRQVDTASGAATARFTVVRVPEGTMPEGRIQFCQHHTPEVVWQPRWTGHANGAIALTGVVLCVADPAEAAQRYTRFTGLLAQSEGGAWHLGTARGQLTFVGAEMLERAFGIAPPALPWIAATRIASGNPAGTERYLRDSGADVRALPHRRLLVVPPAAVGSLFVFEPAAAPWRFE